MVVLAPHADDETIGAWALMRHRIAARARVTVIVVSDGAGSHPGSLTWPRARLTRERRRETRRAMASLAVAPSRIRFLGLPDGTLDRDPAQVRRAIARALRRHPVPDLIVGPVADDAHADHRAVAHALAALPRRGEWRLGYQVWPEGAGRAARAFRVRLGAQALRAKRRTICGYRTQMGMIRDAEAGFAMTARHLRAFVRPAECFRILA
jgi:LmbE family N-acetylglucosaminyl deacetylase